MKVLIVTKDLNSKGGISIFFRTLVDKFTFPVTFFIAGSRVREVGFLTGVIRLFYDYLYFISIVSSYRLVHINTSMRPKAILRDSLFLLLAKAARRKTIVFIHGWNVRVSGTIERYFLWLYKIIYFQTNAFIVLSSDFVTILRNWGYAGPVYMLTGLVDEALLEGVNEKFLSNKSQDHHPIQILFLARLEKEKGVYQAIDIYHILKKRYKNIELVIAGDGHEYRNTVEYVSSLELADVHFIGFIRGEKKRLTFMKADIYLFPTFYGEGMPLSVFEAMAFGLPVITCPVGGIKDFFKDGQMGFLVDSRRPEDFTPFVEKLVISRPFRTKIALHNYHYVQANHLSTTIVKKLEDIYKTFLP